MASKKREQRKKTDMGQRAEIENAGIIAEQRIIDTLQMNYMPYAMSVIVSRAIPEIDGFKPSHRKILYTMYTMGLLTGQRTKSANIVGQTMRLNPHGEQAIYETMVRLSRGYEALLHAYVDSKGNFGKAYSRDMAYAASRYTEAKLDALCSELFRDIDKDTVDFIDNYDSKMKEPALLPVTFPAILVNSNVGIAVGMASSICPFNLAEICEATISVIKNPAQRARAPIAPDFPGGGLLIYDQEELEKINSTGRGSVRLRAKYTYDDKNNCIDITEIPPSTTIEAIMDKSAELLKNGKVKEISDMRDETDLSGLKITVDLKRGVDWEKLMYKLYKLTPLEDSFSCNFNILVAGIPRVMGIYEIINEWIAFRQECVKRRVFFELTKKNERLHLLKGLGRILLDIDKAVKIVRETDEEAEVVPNLMISFGIDEMQAEYVAEIRLRHLNREYILNRTREISELEKSVQEMRDVLSDITKIKSIIIDELKAVIKKYQKPRRTAIIYAGDEENSLRTDEAEDYAVNLFFTRDGYFKKITAQSFRMGGAQKMKDGDVVTQLIESRNYAELMFFSDRCQVYKTLASEFEDAKTSQLGDYIPARVGMDEGESAVYLVALDDYVGYMLFFFANGKVAKVEMSSYKTKTRRRKLIGAYGGRSPLVSMFYIKEDMEFLIVSSGGKALIIHTGMIAPKAARDTQGVQVLSLRKGSVLQEAMPLCEDTLANPHRFRPRSIPAAGQPLNAQDRQITFENYK